ncbi:MAG TPA: putative PEP-binding protein, partial [Dehalococcoidia bacterium]|nr:putative PEP-binding protein [Dehalococcoidia bacterium]
EPSFHDQADIIQLLDWANEIKRLGVWANADYPKDAAKAVEFGAEGIGLCRTEHMFFEEERLPIVRQMILAAPEARRLEEELDALRREAEAAPAGKKEEVQARLGRAEARVQSSPAVNDFFGALQTLLRYQTEDFKGIFRVMGGRPVVIRLLDPPLHEFLPRQEELIVQVTELRCKDGDAALLQEMEDLLKTVERMREQNPMLGTRGCRLGLIYPAINEMQVRAILGAAIELKRESLDVRPEIMIPLVGHVNEIRLVREQLERVARQVEEEMSGRVPYKFGTMMEIPRACLVAGEIARYAEFFSFGTNDLTQTTYGISRDDAEAGFLLNYVQRGILPANPFQVLDREGVGQLMEMGVKGGRSARPDLKVGICGEHGGEPSSIEFCHSIGLDYVSCSPFRVPVARLAAAQAALGAAERDK